VNPALGMSSHALSAPSLYGFAVQWTSTSTNDTYFFGTYALTQ